jgi:membrane protease subunit (stomatin/prohibitin family)
MNETIILTSENLHALGSNNGVGWNRKQLAVLGINWPAKKGWLTGLIGKEISLEKYQTLMMLRKSNQNQSNAKQTSKERPSKPWCEATCRYLLKRCRNQLMIVSDTLSDDKIELVNELDKILGKNIQRFP